MRLLLFIFISSLILVFTQALTCTQNGQYLAEDGTQCGSVQFCQTYQANSNSVCSSCSGTFYDGSDPLYLSGDKLTCGTVEDCQTYVDDSVNNCDVCQGHLIVSGDGATCGTVYNCQTYVQLTQNECEECTEGYSLSGDLYTCGYIDNCQSYYLDSDSLCQVCFDSYNLTSTYTCGNDTVVVTVTAYTSVAGYIWIHITPIAFEIALVVLATVLFINAVVIEYRDDKKLKGYNQVSPNRTESRKSMLGETIMYDNDMTNKPFDMKVKDTIDANYPGAFTNRENEMAKLDLNTQKVMDIEGQATPSVMVQSPVHVSTTPIMKKAEVASPLGALLFGKIIKKPNVFKFMKAELNTSNGLNALYAERNFQTWRPLRVMYMFLAFQIEATLISFISVGQNTHGSSPKYYIWTGFVFAVITSIIIFLLALPFHAKWRKLEQIKEMDYSALGELRRNMRWRTALALIGTFVGIIFGLIITLAITLTEFDDDLMRYWFGSTVAAIIWDLVVFEILSSIMIGLSSFALMKRKAEIIPYGLEYYRLIRNYAS